MPKRMFDVARQSEGLGVAPSWHYQASADPVPGERWIMEDGGQDVALSAYCPGES